MPSTPTPEAEAPKSTLGEKIFTNLAAKAEKMWTAAKDTMTGTIDRTEDAIVAETSKTAETVLDTGVEGAREHAAKSVARAAEIQYETDRMSSEEKQGKTASAIKLIASARVNQRDNNYKTNREAILALDPSDARQQQLDDLDESYYRAKKAAPIAMGEKVKKQIDALDANSWEKGFFRAAFFKVFVAGARLGGFLAGLIVLDNVTTATAEGSQASEQQKDWLRTVHRETAYAGFLKFLLYAYKNKKEETADQTAPAQRPALNQAPVPA